MATCPHCGELVGERHRCHERRKRFVRGGIVACLGALVGTIAQFMVFPGYKGYPWSVTTMTVLGALAALTLWRTLLRRTR